MADSERLSRRALIAGAAGVSGAALVGCRTGPRGEAGAAPAKPSPGADEPVHLPYFGARQVGVTAPTQPTGVVAAYDVTARDLEQLRTLLLGVTSESARLVTGQPYETPDGSRRPTQPGTIANPPPPANLSITVALGATSFDDRFGLADQRPRDLDPMPAFPGDALAPERSHGDLLVAIGSTDVATNRFALRQLHRATRGLLRPRWALEVDRSSDRNPLGFHDHTANLATDDAAAMDRFVWVGETDDEPAWTTDGTYAVVRTTRLLLEDWDGSTLDDQERTIGRRRGTGAPLDGPPGASASTPPDFAADPDGRATPLDAHIRLANPRTPATAHQRILRRGASYARGVDADGRLDEGVLFLSFQRSIRDQFTPIQARLVGEPLARYARAEGGGHWFVLPGVADHDRYLGDTLLEG